MRAALPSLPLPPSPAARRGMVRPAARALLARFGGSAGGGGDGTGRETRAAAAPHGERGGQRGGRGGPAAPPAAGAMSADEEELQVPEEMFKDVKFFVVGDIDPKVAGGGGAGAGSVSRPVAAEPAASAPPCPP